MSDYIKTLQTNLKDYLNSCSELLSETESILYETTKINNAPSITKAVDYKESRQQLQRKINDVILLQIRVPIVAPMKAGKSTIINALIGFDFLPSRVDAMTALPTTVVLKLGGNYDATKPSVELVLQDETLNAIRTLQSNVVQELQLHFTNDTLLEECFKNNPHLTKLARGLRNNTELAMKLENKVSGTNEVQCVLTFINDLVRISFYLSLQQSTLSLSLNEFRDNIPTIIIHNCPIQNTEHRLEQPCQVLLIDTPGPDESNNCTRLYPIIKSELEKADIVFAVVEYTHINTEAGKAIADEIKKIRAMKNNQDCIYVLISKADQYQRKDMTKPELISHVSALFDVSKDRVFELSGKYALIAQKFFDVYQKSQKNNDNIPIENCELAKDVLEAFSVDWEEDLKTATPAEVARKAERLYVRSGLGSLLKTMLGAVLGQVVQRCIESAINICTGINNDVFNDVIIRLNGFEVIEAKLHKEIDDLNQDIEYISNIKKKYVSRLCEITKTLNSEIQIIFQNSSDECQQLIETIFNSNDVCWNDPERQDRRSRQDTSELVVAMSSVTVSAMAVGKAARHIGGPVIGGLGIITGAALASLTTKEIMRLMHGREDEISFDNLESAQQFINAISKTLNENSQKIYTTIEGSVKSTCSRISQEFYNCQGQETLGILERASARLNDTFNIEIIVPKELQLKYEDLNFNSEDVGRIETSWLWTIYSKLTNNENRCFLSRSTLQDACQKSIEDKLKQIEKNVVEETVNEMNAKVILHFRSLRDYMEKYKGYAQLCLGDKLLDNEKQMIFKSKLQELNKAWKSKKDELNELNDNIDWNQLSQRT